MYAWVFINRVMKDDLNSYKRFDFRDGTFCELWPKLIKIDRCLTSRVSVGFLMGQMSEQCGCKLTAGNISTWWGCFISGGIYAVTKLLVSLGTWTRIINNAINDKNWSLKFQSPASMYTK